MPRIVILGALFTSLCAGCLPPRLLASRDVAHIIAEDDTVIGYCRAKDGHVEKCRVVVREGDVCAPGEILKVMEARDGAGQTDL